MRSVFLFSAVVLAVNGCRPSEDKPAPAAPPAVNVKLAVAEVVETPALTPVSGVVRASRQGSVAAQVMGDVVAVPAQLGAKVAAGDVLVRLGSAELDARLAQARAALSEVERSHAQESRLLAKGASTRDMVADLADRLAAAQANVAAVQASVNHLAVRAPFAGVVSGKFVDVGDLAAPGRVLVEVHAAGPVEIETGIPVSFASLPVGAEVGFELAGRQGRARVKEIATSADARSLNRRVLLVATDDALTPGKPVTVLWPAEPRRRVLVPASAIQRHGQIERVWAVDASGKLALRLVRVAGTEDSRIEVASGLRGGEQVVESPVDGLVEGAHANAR
jgi:RND family efflux transporter MFP subunit